MSAARAYPIPEQTTFHATNDNAHFPNSRAVRRSCRKTLGTRRVDLFYDTNNRRVRFMCRASEKGW